MLQYFLRLFRKPDISDLAIRADRLDNPHETVFTASLNGEWVGETIAKEHTLAAYYIYNVQVLPKYRRLGIASALMSAVMQTFGHESMILYAGGETKRCVLERFYQTYGFEIIDDGDPYTTKMIYTPRSQ